MKRKWLFTIVILFFSAVFVFAVWKVIEIQLEYQTGKDTYSELDAYIDIPESVSPETDQTINQNQSGEENIDWPIVDFAALREINPDIVAWIYLEGTEINYPVVQGTDNDYYLKHMFEGSWNSAGCIFLDSRNASDFSDRHSVIYGHHMRNGSMFSALDEYKVQEFYDEHPTILLMTPEGNYIIEVFSAYVTNVNENAWDLAFTQTDYEAWLEETKKKSCFTSSLTPKSSDRVVTLSTCSYEFDNARFVVVGILK